MWSLRGTNKGLFIQVVSMVDLVMPMIRILLDEVFYNTRILRRMMKKLKLLSVLLTGIAMLVGCQPATEDDTTSPSLSNGSLVFSNLTSTSLTVGWIKASDNSTPESSLKYQVFFSTTDNLDSAANIETNGTEINSATTDITSYEVTGLHPNRTYFINVVVEDRATNKTVYTANSVVTKQSFPMGNYVDDYKYTHFFSSTTWINGISTYMPTKINTANRFMVALNGTNHPYNPSKYSRLDWVRDSSGQLYYCQTAFDKSTAAEAETVDTADNSDPANGGCSGFAWSKLTEVSEIIGNYVDDYKTAHTISAGLWVNGQSNYTPIKLDADSRFLVAQNSANNAYNPSRYSRFDWTTNNGQLYYCQVAYDKATSSEAEAVDTADSSDLVAGCSGFYWSALNSVPDIQGDFVDGYKGTHTVNATSWANGQSTYEIIKIDNSSKFLVAQNGEGNAYSPSKFSRFDWTTNGSGQLYYCQVAYDKTTAAEAEAVDPPDAADPANSGCGGFNWSSLHIVSDIVGSFVDDWGYPHTISSTKWINGQSTFDLTTIDSSNRYIVAQNGANNSYSASLYSRFDWTIHDQQLFYCQSAYDKSTAAEAETVGTADPADLTGGCGGFAWSKLKP